jgi:Ca2+-binding EF-hand superfamily protein
VDNDFNFVSHVEDYRYGFLFFSRTNTLFPLNCRFLQGSYLVRCNTKVLESIIDIKPAALIFIACGVVGYYGFAMLVGGQVIILAWTWVFCCFFVLAFNIYFEWYLVNLRDKFLPRKILELWNNEEDRERELSEQECNMSVGNLIAVLERTDSIEMGESSGLLDNASNADSTYSTNMNRAELPLWCDVDLDSVRHNWLTRKMVRGTPDRQQALFWFSHKGPEVFVLILQIQLLFIGIFVGFVVLHYAPFIYRHNGIWMTILYLVLSLGPLYYIDKNNKPLINVLSQINCIGHLRKPHIVSDVLLEEKSASVVQVFLILYKIRKFAEMQASGPTVHERRGSHINPRDVHAMMARNTRSFTNLELHEVGKTFDAIDGDGNGEIDREEMSEVMLRMGANIPPEGLDQLFSLLDKDCNGSIERDEFIAWYADHMEADKDISPKERAHELFNSFDLNHCGEITIGMFKRKLDNFKFGFNIDEIGAIANELDRDRSGTISLHEFERMLVKYHPKSSNTDDSNTNGH